MMTKASGGGADAEECEKKNEINVNHFKMLVDVKCLFRKVSIHSLSSQSVS